MMTERQVLSFYSILMYSYLLLTTSKKKFWLYVEVLSQNDYMS